MHIPGLSTEEGRKKVAALIEQRDIVDCDCYLLLKEMVQVAAPDARMLQTANCLVEKREALNDQLLQAIAGR